MGVVNPGHPKSATTLGYRQAPFLMRRRSRARGSVSTAGGCLLWIGLTP